MGPFDAAGLSCWSSFISHDQAFTQLSTTASGLRHIGCCLRNERLHDARGARPSTGARFSGTVARKKQRGICTARRMVAGLGSEVLSVNKPVTVDDLSRDNDESALLLVELLEQPHALQAC